jgi:fermentation-respiration switch protein FrsA (DUF1100 family)
VVVGAPPHGWPLALLEQARLGAAPGSAEVLRIERETARVMGGKLGPEETFLGYPGTWWNDLAGRDAVAGALRLQRPVLFLRGERDTLVTEDDLRTFRRALARLPGAEVDTVAGADALLYPREGERLAAAATKRIADFLLAVPPAPAEAPGNPDYPGAPSPGR